ncbi:MAG: O-antigen ligase family protein, partial [Thermomicrobiaceae bacterium]|nr:O-antigen ligase family protein [Thermomicrobiaceae bacterium]
MAVTGNSIAERGVGPLGRLGSGLRRAAADPARSPLVAIGALAACLLVGTLTAMPGLEVLPIALLALGVGLIVLKQPFYGLVIWLGVAPFASVRGSAMLAAAYDGMHRLLILALVLVLVLGALAQRRSLRLGLPEALMALYALYTIGSLLSASGNLRGDAMTVYDRILLPFGAYFLARELVDRPARFQTIATVLIAVAALQGLISLGGIVPGLRAVLPAVWFHREDRLTGSLGNPAAFGATMVMILVLLNHARRYTTNPDKQVLIRVASLLGALSLLLTFSRSVWISAALVLLLSLRANRNLARSLVPIAVVTLAIVFSGLLARETAYANARLHNEETIYGRIAKIYASVHMWEVHPIFGWGYRQMDDHFDQY